MRFATWNVNSIRARLPRLTDWLSTAEPDILCLQETKSTQDGFPRGELADLGYDSAHHGDGRWNGVAILSRVGLADVRPGLPGDPRGAAAEPRCIAATCGGIRAHSVYVPNGRALDDPHYAYKLAWLAALREHLATAYGPADRVVVAGDVNVARTDADVWDAAVFAGSTHVTPAERQAVDDLVGLGLRDVVRDAHPEPGLFTYWDYRAGAYGRRMGMRIDLVLASAPVAATVQAAYVDREARKGKGASDHAPVVVDLAGPGEDAEPPGQP